MCAHAHAHLEVSTHIRLHFKNTHIISPGSVGTMLELMLHELNRHCTVQPMACYWAVLESLLDTLHQLNHHCTVQPMACYLAGLGSLLDTMLELTCHCTV